MPTILFLSTMFTADVLVVHHAMALFCTKKICSGDLFWKHSIVNVASKEYNKIAANVYKLESNFENLDSTVECESVDNFEKFLYDSKPFDSETSVVVGAPI